MVLSEASRVVVSLMLRAADGLRHLLDHLKEFLTLLNGELRQVVFELAEILGGGIARNGSGRGGAFTLGGEEVGKSHAHRRSQPLQRRERWHGVAVFDAGEIGAEDAGALLHLTL